MGISTGRNAKLYIGPAVTDATDSIAEFEALSWTLVGQVISIGAHGDAANDVSVSVIGDARVRHQKGARDAGTSDVTCAHDPLDVGQLAMKAAQRTADAYAFRLNRGDHPTDAYQDTVEYFRARVNSARTGDTANDTVQQTVFQLGIDSEIFEDVAALSV